MEYLFLIKILFNCLLILVIYIDVNYFPKKYIRCPKDYSWTLT